MWHLSICILASFAALSGATCTPGKDGRDMTVTVTTQGTCYNLQTDSMDAAVNVCNATAGALARPTDVVQITSVAPLCQLLTTDDGQQLRVCDGAKGPTGTTGATGATGDAGVAATITVPSVTTGSFLSAAAPPLGRAAGYAVLAAAGIASTGSSLIYNGDIGSYPTGTVTGFPPGLLSNGVIHTTADLATANARSDAGAAFLSMQSMTCTDNTALATDIGGTTVKPGVHCYGASLGISGTLTLDAQGNQTAIFIFVTTTTLTTAASASIVLANNAQPCNVFFAVGTSATIGSGTSFSGSIFAATSISLGSAVTTTSRVFAGLVFASGSVTLQAANIATQGVACNGTVTVNSTCATLTSGSQAMQLCNGLSPAGPTGAQGPVGATGPAGLNGTTGATGPNGFMGVIPNTIAVDGTQYALTRAGIQAALDAANALGNVTVSVGGSVVSDGTPLRIPNYVTLNFNMFTYSFPANATSFDLITAVGSTATSTSSLLTTAWEGNNFVTLTVANADLFMAGDMVYLTGGSSHGVTAGGSSTARAGMQANVITRVDTVTGNITLKDPLAFDFTVAQGATIARVASPVWGPGLRNVIINGNGNTGALSRAVVFENVMFAQIRNVQITGSLAQSMSGATVPTEYQYRVAGIYVFGTVNSLLENLHSRNFGSSTSARDIGIGLAGSCSVKNIRSIQSGGAGPALLFATYTTLDGLISSRQQTAGFKLDTCAYCTLTNLHLLGQQNATNGIGLVFAYGSHNNMVRNVIMNGNQNAGLGFMGDGDSYNQITGHINLQSNGSSSVLMGIANANPVGNFFAGLFDKPVAMYGGATFASNAYQQVSSAQGFYSFNINSAAALTGQKPALTDFPNTRSIAMYVTDETQIHFALRDSAGNVKQAAYTLS